MIEEVMSEAHVFSHAIVRRIWESLTGVQCGRNRVEHVSIHVGVDSPVRRGVIPGGNEDGIPLGDSERDQVDGGLLDVSLFENN